MSQSIVIRIVNSQISVWMTLLLLLGAFPSLAKNKKASQKIPKTEYHTGAYRNLFLEAGYSQADIDRKVEKAYHDRSEGPNPIYFEVGDSLGLKSTVATASLIGNDKKSLDFVHSLWNAKLELCEDGYFDPYYDGLMYLFSLMHLSGKYQIITPQTR